MVTLPLNLQLLNCISPILFATSGLIVKVPLNIQSVHTPELKRLWLLKTELSKLHFINFLSASSELKEIFIWIWDSSRLKLVFSKYTPDPIQEYH